MNREFLEQQKQDIHNKRSQLHGEEIDKNLKKKLFVLYDFVSSLLESDKFTDPQKEDLRKLALELRYTENTSFEEWLGMEDNE